MEIPAGIAYVLFLEFVTLTLSDINPIHRSVS